MQNLAWADLEFLLALSRSASVASAARQLGVDGTTVSRRLSRLEQQTGWRLARRERGRLWLTDAGQRLVTHAERMEAEVQLAAQALNLGPEPVSGSLRVTAVPVLAYRLLVPRLAELTKRHPALQLELVAESRDLTLGLREADIALRMARPTQENAMLVRRVATLSHAVYAAKGSEDDDLPWIAYDQDHAHLAPHRWIVAQGGDITPYLANDAEGLIALALAGHGRIVLPRIAGDVVSGLVRLDQPCDLMREVWTIVAPSQRHRAAVGAVLDWIGECLSARGTAAS